MLTAYPNGLSSFGSPVIGGPFNIPYTPLGSQESQVVFVDADNGRNGNAGDDPSVAVQTITRALALVDSGVGAMIFIAPGTYEENVVVTKDYIHLIGSRGPRYGWPDIAPASGVALSQSACQGLFLHRLRFAAPAADVDLALIEGNGNIFDTVVFDGDATQGNAKALLRLKGNADDDSYTASEGIIRRCLFRGSGGVGLAFDTGDAPTNGVGVTDALVEECTFIGNDQPDLIAADTGGGVYAVQGSNILRCYFMTKNKATYIDIQTDLAAGNTNNMFAGCYLNDDTVDTTAVKMQGTSSGMVGCFSLDGVIDGDALD